MKLNINDFETNEPGSSTMPPDDNSGAPPAAMPSPKSKKSAIVTKEELAKSGYDNLRDYLNAKQGLTRRKEKNPAPKLIDPKNIRSGRREFEESQIAPKLIDPSNIKSGSRPEEEALLKTPAKRLKSVENKETSDMTYRHGGKVKKMASGGSVSSASSRADGCATKGKTKGTMIAMKSGGKC